MTGYLSLQTAEFTQTFTSNSDKTNMCTGVTGTNLLPLERIPIALDRFIVFSVGSLQ